MLCQWGFSPGGTFWHRSRKQVAGREDCIHLHCVWVMETSGDAGRTEALGATWGGRVNLVEPGHSAPMARTYERGQETPTPTLPSPRRQLGDAASPAALGQPPGSSVSALTSEILAAIH